MELFAAVLVNTCVPGGDGCANEADWPAADLSGYWAVHRICL